MFYNKVRCLNTTQVMGLGVSMGKQSGGGSKRMQFSGLVETVPTKALILLV